MKQFIVSGEHERQGSPEFEAEVLRDSELALELEQQVRKNVLLPWLAEHPDVDWTCTGPALLRLAALEILAGAPGTTPDDFAEMARELAKMAEPVAREVAAKARAFLNLPPQAEPKRTPDEPDRPETIVQKQVRLVLEQQCREIAEKLTAMVPAGVGFALFLMDYGVRGNLAYVSTVSREDMIKQVKEWLARQEGER
jgi:hypothetical protein